MAVPSDPKDLITLQELAVSNAYEIAALARLRGFGVGWKNLARQLIDSSEGSPPVLPRSGCGADLPD